MLAACQSGAGYGMDRSNEGETDMRAILALIFLAALGHGARAAETMRIGLLHTLSPAPLYLAMARGYFGQEGLDAQFKFFEAAQPIAAAAVAGDIDVGITALTGGFFNLAGRGALKVIGGGLHEEKGFDGTALLASVAAFDAGLTSPAKLAGHSMGITQFGSSFHYMAGRIVAHEGINLSSITLRPLQTVGNMIAALRTGQVDTILAIASMAKPLEASGHAKIIAWVGNLVPYQITAVFAPSRMTADHADELRRFAAAYKHGVEDYRAAFLRQEDGKPVHDAKTDAAIADIEKFVFTGDPAAREKILEGIGYYDANGALDVGDVEAQQRWFVEQGMVKSGTDPAELIDTRFLPTMP